MAPDTGRHDANEDAIDRARIDYLAGEVDTDLRLGEADRIELDELRELLADPTLWAEPPAELEDAVVAAIAAEAAALPPLEGPFDESSENPGAAAPAAALGLGDRVPATPASVAAPSDLAAARRRRQERSGRSRWTRPTMLIAAAAAVVVVAGGALLLRPPADRTFDVAFQATELAPDASGGAVMIKSDSGWEIKLNVTGLPRLDNGRFYQGWLRNADGVLVPIGTFNEGTDVVLWSGVSPDTFPTLTVTQEEADGNQDSSGLRVLVGTAVEVK
ncbi:MAG TPA: anti-sigma factor [Nakamurella sp.]